MQRIDHDVRRACCLCTAMLILVPISIPCGYHWQLGHLSVICSTGAWTFISLCAACCAGAFTFSVPTEVGFGVEADPNPPRLMGAPFAADLHASHCYAILPCGQVRHRSASSAAVSYTHLQQDLELPDEGDDQRVQCVSQAANRSSWLCLQSVLCHCKQSDLRSAEISTTCSTAWLDEGSKRPVRQAAVKAGRVCCRW